MKKINRKSGFVIFEENHDRTSPYGFEFVYNTKNGRYPYRVSFDGVTCKNCVWMDDNTLKVMFEDHKLEIGELLCERKWTIVDKDFVKGQFPTFDTRTTGIELTNDITDGNEATISVPTLYQQGLNGLSAYEIAVKLGYEGTEAE